MNKSQQYKKEHGVNSSQQLNVLNTMLPLKIKVSKSESSYNRKEIEKKGRNRGGDIHSALNRCQAL